MTSSSELPETHSLFEPLGCRWNDANDLLLDFEGRFSLIFSGMLCCAICGTTKLINKSTSADERLHTIVHYFWEVHMSVF